jgi:hypothetical protein
MEEEYSRKKWEMLGFLEGVPENRKDKVVESMNFATNWLTRLKENSDEDTSELETITLPVMLRIALQVDMTKAEVLESCKELRQQWEKFDRTRFPKTVDPEAAFCKAFGEMKISQYKNKLI